MGRAGKAAFWAATLAAGATAGYLGERAVLRSRLQEPTPVGPAMGSIAGEVSELRGPDGIRITTEVYGPADGPQIVLAHGWTNTGRIWHEQVLALADRYRIVTYDQPGHGRTSSPRSRAYDMDTFGDVLKVVIDEHVDRSRPLVLGGHSLGGMTVLNYTRRHGGDLRGHLQGVLLLSTTSLAGADDVPIGFGIHSVARIEAAVARILALGRPEATYLADRFYRASSDLSFVLTKLFGLGPNAASRHVDFVEQLVLDSDFDMITAVMAPILTLNEDEALTCLTAPTRIVVGSADKLTPVSLARRMVDRCANAELIELPGIGHMTPLEAADTVNALLVALVEGDVKDEVA